MAARLGNALYFAAILLALTAIGLAIYIWTQPAPQAATLWFLAIVGGVVFLIGRGFRYVLAGQ